MSSNTPKNKTLLSHAFEWNKVCLNQKNRETPSSRWGHSMTLTENDLFVFGGFASNSHLLMLFIFCS